MIKPLNDPDDLHGLFPVPVQLLRRVVSEDEARSLSTWVHGQLVHANSRSGALVHTGRIVAGQHTVVDALSVALLPRINEFGALLLGQARSWRIKEMWGNVMHAGGAQSVHNHANCMVSGIIYLTPTGAAGSRTVFIKALGGQDYKFSNEHAGMQPNLFNASRWVAPEADAGDVLLFPSYLLHEVPPQNGPLRCTLAFNAIPDRLDSWGYGIGFGP